MAMEGRSQAIRPAYVALRHSDPAGLLRPIVHLAAESVAAGLTARPATRQIEALTAPTAGRAGTAAGVRRASPVSTLPTIRSHGAQRRPRIGSAGHIMSAVCGPTLGKRPAFSDEQRGLGGLQVEQIPYEMAM